MGMSCSNDEVTYEYTDYTSLYEQLISQRPKGNMFEGELNYSDDFSHIEIFTEQTFYKSTDNVIKCRIINHLAGNGFWFCFTAFIEKEINGKWENEPLTDECLDQVQWFFCAVPSLPDSEFSTLSIFNVESVRPHHICRDKSSVKQNGKEKKEGKETFPFHVGTGDGISI